MRSERSQIDDIFAVETDIATNIADALQAKLTGASGARLLRVRRRAPPRTSFLRKGVISSGIFGTPGYDRLREYFLSKRSRPIRRMRRLTTA